MEATKLVAISLPLLAGLVVPKVWDEAHKADKVRCEMELEGLKLVTLM